MPAFSSIHDGSDHHNQDSSTLPLQLRNLKVISILGCGANGVVFLVRTENAQLLALKAVLRSSIDKKKIASTGNGNERRRFCFEGEILSCLHHPLLPSLHGVLITDKIAGYPIDYCPGRDLNFLRNKQPDKMFSDEVIRFYAAELVLAVEYLHGLGIIYRDLKPVNVMIRSSGHLMLVDFDLSTKLSAKPSQSRAAADKSNPEIKPKNKTKIGFFFRRRDSEISPDELVGGGSIEKANSFAGTEDYLAPEIILRRGHGFPVDWWCLGVMLYEMLYGTTPFRGANRRETFERIVNKEPMLTGRLTPLRDLIGRLLEKDQQKRICVAEIKGHDFFSAVDWEGILDILRPPFIPELTDVEEMDENKDINVEDYVQRVFEVGDEDKLKNDEKIGYK